MMHHKRLYPQMFGTLLLLLHVFLVTSTGLASQGEALYAKLSSLARSPEGSQQLLRLNAELSAISWETPVAHNPIFFQGNLRRIQPLTGEALYLVRSVKGELFILALPKKRAALKKGADSPYANLNGMLSSKMTYKIQEKSTLFEGIACRVARFTSPPMLSPIDRIFRIAIVVVLFAVMLGMGMTLTADDFLSIFRQPRGIFVGLLCLFGFMPLIAFAFGHLFGYVASFPFIYVGMILITATPGGATSNLMTHLAKGDVALSISLTAIATVLSLVMTPALMVLYCANLPEIEMPVNMVILPIFVLVLLPLAIGMGIKAKAQRFAEKAVPLFNAVGVAAVLICIVGGIAGNPEMFVHSLEKFGITGFFVIILLAATGMIMGAIVPKLSRISNVQTRAISMEVGIRNAILGMTIALLLQDRMGDYNSYMFAVCGLFAIVMYIIGAAAIFIQKIILPVGPSLYDAPLDSLLESDDADAHDCP